MNESGPHDRATAGEGSVWEDAARTAAERFGALGSEADGGELLHELLVFGLDRSTYAVPVESVREIVRMKRLTLVPRSPAWLLGVIALRGEIVEVVDLRRRLGLGASSPSRSNRIIVLHGDVDRVTGLLVDSVSEVFRVAEDELMPAQGLDASCVGRVCGRNEEFVSILDVERTLEVGDG